MKPGRSTLVESHSSARTPCLPSSPKRPRSMILPSMGVESILKSPVWTIVPILVRMAKAAESAMEWFTWINSTSNLSLIHIWAISSGPRNAASNALAARPAETAHPVLPRARPPGTAVVKRIPAAVVRNKNEKHRTENPRLSSVSYPYKCKRRGAICSAPLVIQDEIFRNKPFGWEPAQFFVLGTV